MNLSVRYATIDDAELIADISRKTFYETFAPLNSSANMEIFMKVQFTRGRLMMEVGQPGHTFLLAYNNKEVAGYAKLRDTKYPPKLDSNNALEIARLYAMPHMIGKGVGKLLMEKSLEIASDAMKDAVWLGVWKQNKKAIDFYSSWGFEIFNECDFILGNEVQKDWLMRKKLVSKTGNI